MGKIAILLANRDKLKIKREFHEMKGKGKMKRRNYKKKKGKLKIKRELKN